MNFFKKIFGSSDAASDEEHESEYGGGNPIPNSHLSIDEQFIFNFKKTPFFRDVIEQASRTEFVGLPDNLQICPGLIAHAAPHN